MGWNNWNAFGCDVSEELLLTTAEAIVNLGLRDLGYNYVVLDDCWQSVDGRDKDGRLQPEPSKFPHGLNFISDHLHSKGLQYGMYSSAEGSLDHEIEDAQSFASWGVDFLKYDSCYHMGRIGTPQISFNRFKAMADALKATGRPILLNLCNWGEDFVHTWGMSIANSWRISGDIYDAFTRPDDLCGCDKTLSDPYCIAPGTHCSVLFILNKIAAFADRSIPGGWSDLDMLEVGQGGMTDEEYKAHFALWAALKSPLFLGNDIRDMPASALTIINNPAILALSQDPHGRSITRVRRDVEGVAKDEWGVGETHVWSGYLANGDEVVILLNAGGEDLEMQVSLAEIFTSFGPGGSAPHVKSDWAVHDLWANRMPEETAISLITAATADDRIAIFREAGWYNATETPYEIGLRNNDPRLFGEKISVVEAGGVLKAPVKSHAARVFRLRRIAKPGEKLKGKSLDRVTKDEL
ncbi:glycoside hydrolase superfamily [Xylariales sp. PMI_506]|nr:glycoside hydrolase superfamily [Xylariales sp. PMI_506]